MNYYNEHDGKAAAWLRELVSRKLIPAGDVDTRSIAEIKAHELKGYIQCHFFAGVAGWSLALQLADWPEDRPVWTGSCPCQPFSTAGKGLAQEDERHLWPAFFNLIRECRPEHVFGEQVASAIGHGWLDGVSADLEGEGYACGATVLGAHSVNAPHQRQRLYWVAHSHNARPQRRISEELREYSNQCTSGEGGSPDGLDDARCPSDERRGELGNVGSSAGEEQGEARQRQWSRDADSDSVQDDCGLVLSDRDGCVQGRSSTSPAGHRYSTDTTSGWSAFRLVHCRDGKTRRIPTEPAFFPLAHGIPARVVRLRGYGNAIVPQCAQAFIEAYCDIQRDRFLGMTFNEREFWG